MKILSDNNVQNTTVKTIKKNIKLSYILIERNSA